MKCFLIEISDNTTAEFMDFVYEVTEEYKTQYFIKDGAPRNHLKFKVITDFEYIFLYDRLFNPFQESEDKFLSENSAASSPPSKFNALCEWIDNNRK